MDSRSSVVWAMTRDTLIIEDPCFHGINFASQTFYLSRTLQKSTKFQGKDTLVSPLSLLFSPFFLKNVSIILQEDDV